MFELVYEKIFDEAYSYFKKVVKNESKNYHITRSDIEQAINSHMKFVELWSKEIFMRDMIKGKKTDRTYVGLNINVAPRKIIPKSHVVKNKSILGILKGENNIILLGDPGAGKTTTLKYLCQKLIFSNLKSLEYYSFPIVIPLRNLGEEERLYDRLRDIFGVHVYWGENEITFKGKFENDETRFMKKFLNGFIDSLKVLLLIDGLDELSPWKLYNTVQEIKELSTNLKYSKMILTCRSGAYNILVENTRVYEICHLTEKQIKSFCNKWFNNKGKSQTFLNELSVSPLKDTANRPLILALLCSLYGKYLRLPEKPKFIYKKIIRLLIDEWDTQRQVKRESNFKLIDSDTIIDFLTKFAFELTINYPHKEYSYEDIQTILNELFRQFEISINELENFLFDIETQNGIFIKSSYDTYEFYHKSIQEYLSAEYILGLPEIPTEIIYSYDLSNELAISVCLSSNSTVYFCNLILNIFPHFDIDTISYGIKIGEMIGMFLERLLVEKPDFEISPVLPYAFLYMEHYFNLGSPMSIGNLYESNPVETDKLIINFHHYLKSFIKLNSIRKSFLLIKDYITDRKAVKDYRGNVYLELSMDNTMYLRNFETNFLNKLYVNKKTFFPIL